MEPLFDVQRDTISEIIKVAIGRSAAAISNLTGEEIRLSVPRCEFIQDRISGNLPDIEQNSALTVVKQSFSGDFFGNAILAFPESKSLELVKLILDDSFPDESAADMEREALMEVGNLVLNGFLGSIGNELDIAVPTSLPVFSKVNKSSELFGSPEQDPRAHNIILVIHVNFEIQNKKINGYVVLLLDLLAIDNFLELVDSYVARIS